MQACDAGRGIVMSDGDKQAAGLTKLDLMFVFCEGYAHLRCFSPLAFSPITSCQKHPNAPLRYITA
jgi:hypothetical protein